MDPIDSLLQILRPWPIKGKGWLFNRFVPTAGTRRARVFGAEMDLNLGDLIQRGVYIGCFERTESNWVRRALEPGMTFVDIGANIGYFSLLAGSRVGRTGRVIAFEPNPRLKNKLAEAVATKGWTGFEIHPIGLSDHEGRLTLHLPPPAVGNENASMVEWDDADDWEKVEVPVRRLDEVLKASNVSQVDLLKIDVEGHEKPVFEGLGSMLGDGTIRRIMCEFNDPALKQAGTSSRELRDFLIGQGFVDTTPIPWSDDKWLQNRFLVHRSVKA